MDETVMNLFLRMIKHPEKINNIIGNIISFENDLSITCHNKTDKKIEKNKHLGLEIFNYKSFLNDSWIINSCDIDNKLIFCIRTPYTVYTVPEMGRDLYTDVLNTLENAIRAFELRKIGEYFAEFPE